MFDDGQLVKQVSKGFFFSKMLSVAYCVSRTSSINCPSSVVSQKVFKVLLSTSQSSWCGKVSHWKGTHISPVARSVVF